MGKYKNIISFNKYYSRLCIESNTTVTDLEILLFTLVHEHFNFRI